MKPDTEIAEESVVSVMAVLPYSKRPQCAKCGLRMSWYERLVFGGRSASSYIYCEGSVDSTRKVSNIFGQQRELPTECFGVFEEHLHLECNRCSHRMLMHVKGK